MGSGPVPIKARSVSDGICAAAFVGTAFGDQTALRRNVAKADRSRLRRTSVTDPMRPLNRVAGNRAR